MVSVDGFGDPVATPNRQAKRNALESTRLHAKQEELGYEKKEKR